MNIITRLRCITIICAFVVLCHTAVAQQPAANVTLTNAQATEQSPNNLEVRSDELYRIGPGDVVDVVVSKNDVLSRSAVRVDNEGMIQLPMIEAGIQASCRTERELAEDIRTRMLKYMYNPSVYVSIKEYNSQPVAVIGAVNTPGRFKFQRRVRLLELLTYVNGPSERAGRSIQVIHSEILMRCESPSSMRGDEVERALSSYMLEEALQGQENSNPIMQPGDIVRIPDAELVYVIGSVKSAVAISLKEDITLSQAIARAGGALPDSQIDKVRIVRKTPGSMKSTPIIVNLKAIIKLQADDVILLPNDIVDVPGPTAGKKFLTSLLNTVVPSVANLPLRYIY